MRLPLFALIDRCLAPAPKPDKVAWIGEHVYAHRGLHGRGVPENSLAAFAAAADLGLGSELDIQRSNDGQAMVFHDWVLDRMTSETGPVLNRSAEQLGRIALAGTRETVPALHQVLDRVEARAPLLIEVKSRRDIGVSGLCIAVRRVLEGYRGLHAVMSFDPRISRWFAVHAPATVRGLGISEGEKKRGAWGALLRRMAIWHARPDFLSYDVRDLPSRLATAQRKRGLPIAAWTALSVQQRDVAACYADALIAEGAGLDLPR